MNGVNMKYSDDDFYRLINFFGYVQPDAELWILGAREQGSADTLDIRLGFDQIMEMPMAAEQIGKKMVEYGQLALHGEENAIANLYRSLGKKNRTSAELYFAERLFRENHNSFYIPFDPIPSFDGIGQVFSSLFPTFKSYEEYLRKAEKMRVEFMQQALEQYKPKLVLAIYPPNETFGSAFFDELNLTSLGGFEAGWNTDTVFIRLPSIAGLNSMEFATLIAYINENCLPIDPNKDFGPVKLSAAEEEKIKKDAAKAASFAKRKNKTKHNPSDPYCVCEACLNYDR